MSVLAKGRGRNEYLERNVLVQFILSDYIAIAYLYPKSRPLLLKNHFQGINARLEIQTCSSI